MQRPLATIAYGGLLGVVAVIAEHLTARTLGRYLRRQGL